MNNNAPVVYSKNYYQRLKSKGMLRKLQWRDRNTNTNTSTDSSSSGDKPQIPPSTSPLSRKLDASAPLGINNIVVQGRGDDKEDAGTVVTRRSVGTTVTCQTQKCSNRTMKGSEASVTSSTNSLSPLARLSSTKEEQVDEDQDHVPLGSSITIFRISSVGDTGSPSQEEIVFANDHSPTSVIESSYSFGSTKGASRDGGETMSASRAGEPTYVDQVESEDKKPPANEIEISLDNPSASDLSKPEGNPNEESSVQEDEKSTIQTTPLSDPTDVDTCKRPVTPMERRNLRAMHKLGYRYLRHNEINAALDVFMEIFRGQRERHGKKSLEAAMAMHNLGVVCVECGRFEEGVKLCDGAARIRVEQLGADHLDVAVSFAQQGVILMEIEMYPLALTSFREALRIRRKSLGSKHPLVIRVLNNIGCALFEMDELEEAKYAFHEALVALRELMKDSSHGGSMTCTDGLPYDQRNDLELEHRNLEVDPTDTHDILLSIAVTQCNIGSIHVRLGRYDDSLVFYQDALLIQESVLGKDNEAVKSTLESMEFAIQSKEKNRQALPQNNAGTAFPSVLNMDRVTNLILPRYEEGKKLYDKMSNEIAALLDTAASPGTNDNSIDENASNARKPFFCGRTLLCAMRKKTCPSRN